MIRHFFYLFLILLIIQTPVYSQPSKSSPSSSTESSAQQETLTVKEMLERQEKNYEKILDAQKNLSEQAIQAVMREQQTIQTITQISGGVLLLLSLFFSWFVGKQFRRFAKLSKQTNEVLANAKREQGKIERTREEFEVSINSLKNELTELRNKLEYHNENVEQFIIKVTMANLIFVVHSPNLNERLNAARKASLEAPKEGGAITIPVFLAFLRKPDEHPDVIAEVLYGLCSRGKDLKEEEEAIALILERSASSEQKVRAQAVDTMAAIGVDHPQIQNRIQEMCESDPNEEVKIKACNLLKNTAGKKSKS